MKGIDMKKRALISVYDKTDTYLGFNKEEFYGME